MKQAARAFAAASTAGAGQSCEKKLKADRERERETESRDTYFPLVTFPSESEFYLIDIKSRRKCTMFRDGFFISRLMRETERETEREKRERTATEGTRKPYFDDSRRRRVNERKRKRNAKRRARGEFMRERRGRADEIGLIIRLN